MNRARLVVVMLGCLVAVALASIALAGISDRVPDDAFIVLVYAKHLARSGSIYWNAGDGHVDGYTSFLDLVVKTVALRVAPSADPLAVAHVSTLFFHGVVVVGGAAIAYRVAAGRFAIWAATGTLGALAFASNLALAGASGFLLESSLYAATAVLSVSLLLFAPLERRAWRLALGVSWILLALARPEGGPLAVVQAASFVALRRSTFGKRELAEPCALFAFAVASYYLWHLAYFGWLAPNTFYAKTSDSRWLEIQDGIAYVGRYLRVPARGVAHVAVASVGALVFVRRAWEKSEDRARFAILVMLGAVSVLEVVYEGGDGYENGRFLAVPVVFLLLVAICGMGWLRAPWRWAPTVALALFLLEVLSRVAPHQHERLQRIAAWPQTLAGSEVRCDVEPMQLLASRVASMSDTDMQRAKFLADELRVLDLMGLNDMALAHSSRPGQTLWGKGGASPNAPRTNADVMQLGIRMNVRVPMAMHTTEEIVRSPERAAFFFGYPLDPETQDEIVARYVPLSIPTRCGVFLNLFVRRDVASRFANDRVLVGRTK